MARLRFLPSSGTLSSLRWMRPLPILGVALALFQLGTPALPAPAPAPSDPPAARATAEAGAADVTQGALRVTRGEEVVECPLRHTDVRAQVSGFISRVRVTQTFENPFHEPIEAVYVFPLPQGAAVDEMTMVVGERRIAGVVKRRAEARAVYEEALAHGRTAALLEQERPNIFTQSVGNVAPGQQVRVEIAYVDVLPYEGGRYEFHFPMVVGPRYIPGAPAGRSGLGWAPDTTRVPDASRITPPVLKPGFRTGHDVSLSVDVDAGVPLRGLQVHNHQAGVRRAAGTRAAVTLSPADAIPNKDFVLSYHVAGERPQAAVLSHAAAGQEGYFLLMLQPRELDEALRARPPRDVCFLIDVSGSMSGEPMAKVAEAMERFFDRMRPQDRLQVVTFAGSARRLFPGYMPATRETVEEALSLTRRMEGGGGTEMLEGIRAVLADPVDRERVRIVVMLTDGYIGNEDEIIGEVGRRAGDQVRFWTVGVGSSPNRHLLEGVARQGGGASAVLGLRDDPAPLVGSVMDRIQRAQLSRIEIDWGGLDVFETYPARLGELWAGRPVFLLGRHRGAGEARVTLSGWAEGQPLSLEVPVALGAPAAEGAGHAVLAPAWARKKIEHLGDQMAVTGASEELIEEVTEIALQYRLMSAYTSFVAVDESQPAVPGSDLPRRMAIPVPLPEGVSYEGVFGSDEMRQEVKVERDARAALAAKRSQPKGGRYGLGDGRRADRPAALPEAYMAAAAAPLEAGVEGGVVGGVIGGVPGGVVGGTGPARNLAAPPPATLPAGALRRAIAAGAPRPPRPREFEEASRRAQALRDEAEATARQERECESDLPALARTLSLVLRNLEVAAAFERVAAATGVPVDVSAGSLDQAARAYGSRARRIGYLDLRGVTGARALTWIAQPAGLAWRVKSGRVQVGLAAHLQANAASGVESRDGADVARSRETAQAAAALTRWSWRLLAAALDGRVDEAAASELLEAAGAASGAADPLLLRALWAVAAARQASPGDDVVARLWNALAATVRGRPALTGEAALYSLVVAEAAGELQLPPATLPSAGPEAALARLLAATTPDTAAAAELVQALSTRRLTGDDALVLAALALRRQGGPAWSDFRGRAAELARAAGASPSALQVVNRLDRRRGPAQPVARR